MTTETLDLDPGAPLYPALMTRALRHWRAEATANLLTQWWGEYADPWLSAAEWAWIRKSQDTARHVFAGLDDERKVAILVACACRVWDPDEGACPEWRQNVTAAYLYTLGVTR